MWNPFPKSHLNQWEFQGPKLEVPIPYIRPIFYAYVREYSPKYGLKMVQYLHFGILEFALIKMDEPI